MIENFSTSKHLRDVVDYLQTVDNDFYITEENKRVVVNTVSLFKRLLKQSSAVRVSKEKDIDGVILIWKSIGNNVPRYYIKISSADKRVADKLLTAILWNEFIPLHVKIKKDSSLLSLFKNKGFVFQGDRGKEVLLTLNNTFRKKYVNNQHYNKDSSLTE